MWLRTRYQISKVNFWSHVVYLVYSYFWVIIGWVGYNFLLLGFGETKVYYILYYLE